MATRSLTKTASFFALARLVAIVVFGIAPGLGGIIGAGDLQKAVRVRNEPTIPPARSNITIP